MIALNSFPIPLSPLAFFPPFAAQTLLDCIAGRKTIGRMEGVLLFGGKTSTPGFIKRNTGYVEQFDTLVEALTVEQSALQGGEGGSRRT